MAPPHGAVGGTARTALLAAAAAVAGVWVGAAAAQSLPDERFPDLRPELVALVCPERTGPIARSESERLRFEMRARYRSVLPAFFAKVGREPDTVLVMPVDGVRVSQVVDTWHAPRAGARHEGQDLFAPRGTPVRSATAGFVYRIDDLSLGGLSVTVVGGGGRRYFYTHLDSVHEALREGQRVEVGTPLGTVGSSGNAAGTPPHLHFGVYAGDELVCAWEAVDPLPLLVDRER